MKSALVVACPPKRAGQHRRKKCTCVSVAAVRPMRVSGVESHAGALIMSAQRIRPSSGPNTTKPAMVPHQRRDKTGALVSPNGVKLAFRGRRQKSAPVFPCPPKAGLAPSGKNMHLFVPGAGLACAGPKSRKPALVPHQHRGKTGALFSPVVSNCCLGPATKSALFVAGPSKRA